MTDDFNKWWDEDDLTTEGNNFVYGTPAYWAWEGWCAGAKAEREACAKVADEWSKRQDDVGGYIARNIRVRGEKQ
jgi:hypothetical protein